MAEDLGEALDLPQLVAHARPRGAIRRRHADLGQPRRGRERGGFWAIVLERRQGGEARTLRLELPFARPAPLPIPVRGKKIRPRESAIEFRRHRIHRPAER